MHSNAPRIALIGLCALALAMGIGRFAPTPLFPMMQADGLLGISDRGTLASIHFIGYFLGAFAASRVPLPPRATLRCALIAVGLCTLSMGLVNDFAVWAILRWIAGVCSAFILVLVGSHYAARLAAIGQPKRQGWVFSGVGAGIALAGFATLALMIGQFGSNAAWLVFGTVALIGALALCAAMGDEIAKRAAPAEGTVGDRHPPIWALILPYGAMGLGYIIPATYLPLMARELVPSPEVFGWAWPVFGTAAFLSTVLAARLQNRTTNARIWLISQVVLAVGLIAPVVYTHIASIILAGICVGGTFMIITMVGIREVHRLVPAADATRHIAWLTAAFAVGQMVGPAVAGMVHEIVGSFAPTLIVASAVLIASSGLLLRLPSER